MKAGLDNWTDIIILVLYFILVLAVGILSSCRKGRNSVKGYFLAGRSMVWFPIGASLFASNIGSEHFVGLAGSGAASGIAVTAFEWGAALCLPLLGWVFLPIYLSTGVYTVPEYLSKRFGGTRLRTYLSVMALFLLIVTKISVDIYAGSVFIQQALGINTYIAISALLVITAVYTVVGGLTAVIFTDTIQTVIMLTGAVTLSVIGFSKVGGMNGLVTKYMMAVPDSYHDKNSTFNSTLNMTSHCGMPRKDSFHVIRNLDSDLPWPGLLIRSTLISVWYWCADQVMVQRTLAAKDIGHARGATIMAGYLKFLPLFIIIMPGMISRVLYPEEVACSDPDTCMKVCENAVGCSNIAYPKLIFGLAPTGLKGLMMAVMMSALMSSLTSFFNSAATLFTIDIWPKLRKNAGDRELLIVGKIFVVVMVGISVIWIPLIQNSQQGQLFLYIQAVTGYLAPPICAVFLLAVFIPRVNEKGAFWGILCGQLIGITRMVLDFIYPKPKCGESDLRPDVVANVNFMYFSAGLLLFTAILVILISLLTKTEMKGIPVTFWSTPTIKPPSTKSLHYMYRQSRAEKYQLSNVRSSVRQRWSLNQDSAHSNKGFEMEEIKTPGSEIYEDLQGDPPDYPYQETHLQLESKDQGQEIENETRDVDKEAHDNVSSESEDKYYNDIQNNKMVANVVDSQGNVGYEVHDTESNSSLEEKRSGQANSKVKFMEEDKTTEQASEGSSVDENTESRKKVVRKSSKVWKREMEKQPAWQNAMLEFTKKINEADSSKKGSNDKTETTGINILRPSSSRKMPEKKKENEPKEAIVVQKTESETKAPDRTEIPEKVEKPKPPKEEQVQNIHVKQEDRVSKLYPTEEIKVKTSSGAMEEQYYLDQTSNEKRGLDNSMALSNTYSNPIVSRYSGKLSRDLFRSRKSEAEIEIEIDKDDINRQKLYISNSAKWFLDINAVLLICVYVFLNLMFH